MKAPLAWLVSVVEWSVGLFGGRVFISHPTRPCFKRAAAKIFLRKCSDDDQAGRTHANTMAVVPEAANGDNAGAAGAPVRVGAWTIDARANTLQRDGQKAVRLEPRAVEVLLHLAGRPGEVIGREELLAAVWPGVVVGDDALTQAIIKLRKALGDDARQPRYIETISKRGYRLIAAAGQPAPATPAAATPQPPAKRRPTWLAALALALLAILVAGIYWAGRVHDPHPALPIVAGLPLANQ